MKAKAHLSQDVRQGLEALPGCQAFKIRALLSHMDRVTRRKVAKFSLEYREHYSDQDLTLIVRRVVQGVLTRTQKHDADLCEAIEDAFEALTLDLDKYLPEPPKDDLRQWFRDLFGQFPTLPLDYDDQHAWWKAQRDEIAEALRKRVAFGELLAHDAERVYEEARDEMFSVGCAKLAKVAGIDLEDVHEFFENDEAPAHVLERWEQITKDMILPPEYYEANTAERQRAFNFFFDSGMFDLELEPEDE